PGGAPPAGEGRSLPLGGGRLLLPRGPVAGARPGGGPGLPCPARRPGAAGGGRHDGAGADRGVRRGTRRAVPALGGAGAGGESAVKTAIGVKTVGGLLVAHAAGGGSGILTAVRGRLRRVFVLDQGWLVHATSNLLEEQLAEYLVHRQVLSPAAKTHLLEEAQRRNRKLFELALEQGAPPAADFRAAEEAIIADLLSSTLEW